MQLSRKQPLDDEFVEAATNRRHFWWRWLHGQKRSKAQDKAAAAAAARAQAGHVADYNSFDVLAAPSTAQVIMTTFQLMPLHYSIHFLRLSA